MIGARELFRVWRKLVLVANFVKLATNAMESFIQTLKSLEKTTYPPT